MTTAKQRTATAQLIAELNTELRARSDADHEAADQVEELDEVRLRVSEQRVASGTPSSTCIPAWTQSSTTWSEESRHNGEDAGSEASLLDAVEGRLAAGGA